MVLLLVTSTLRKPSRDAENINTLQYAVRMYCVSYLMPEITFACVRSPEDYARCADIWLQASIVGHPFIDKAFWKSNLQAMTEQYLPASTVLIAYDKETPVAFAATAKNVLEALFVLPLWWRKGIGRMLLKRLLDEHQELDLAVYQKNQQATAFYRQMGFNEVRRQVCPHTGEREILMHWERDQTV